MSAQGGLYSDGIFWWKATSHLRTRIKRINGLIDHQIRISSLSVFFIFSLYSSVLTITTLLPTPLCPYYSPFYPSRSLQLSFVPLTVVRIVQYDHDHTHRSSYLQAYRFILLLPNTIIQKLLSWSASVYGTVAQYDHIEALIMKRKRLWHCCPIRSPIR